MGSRFLTDLADVCRRTGLPVVEVDGWQTRARGSGGYNPGLPSHVMAHHTASGPASDGWPDVNYCCFGDSDAPLCNLYLGRDGTIYICAGGATNTNGSGTDPCGATADDSMNSSAIGIEAGNDGQGEPWPDVQQDAYVRLCGELGAAYDIPPGRVHSHFEYAPERKVDPAGPSRWATSGSWDMAAFRAELTAGPLPEPEPEPEPEPVPEDEMKVLVLVAGDADGAAKDQQFWWDGTRIGWMPGNRQRDLAVFVGIYQLDDDGLPYRNLSVYDIQQLINTAWAGGPTPPGYDPPGGR